MRRSTARIKPGSELMAEKLVSLGPIVEPFSGVTETLHSTIELEQLAADSLDTFTSLPADRIDLEIAATLRRVLKACRFDRCGLLALTSDKTAANPIHFSCGERIAATSETFALRAMFPWTGANLLNGNVVRFTTLSELPTHATADRRHYEAMGIKSFLAIPIYVGGSVEFVMVVHQVRTGYLWRKESISMLRLLGEVFANALGRCRNKRTAEVRIEFERFISNLSINFINVTARDVDREVVSAMDKVRKFFQFDRYGLIAFSADKREGLVTHVSYGEGIPPVPEKVDVDALFPWAKERLLSGEIVTFASLEELPEQAAVDRKTWQSFGIKSHFSIPIQVGGSVEYFVVASHVRVPHSIDKDLFPRLRLLGEVFVNALVRCKGEAAQRASLEEIQRLKEKLQSEAEYLNMELSSCRQHEEIIGQSDPLISTLVQTEQVAPTGSTVLICGETGTGKELIAREIHKLSQRRNKLMVKINCASLPAALVESELFGREKGAYTGALTRQEGRFELADGGTIFLDEIAEMSLELQAKLLRVLQEGQFERLGSNKTIQVDVRVIAATNRNLTEEVKKGTFREDLYYRLNVFQIVVPPLRDRINDIPLLVWTFVNEFGEKMGKKINKITKQDMTDLQRYQWPGNVRELRNVIEHAVIVSPGERLLVRLPEKNSENGAGMLTLEECEARHIREALRLTGWRIKGEGGAAMLLGINPSTLYSRMQKLGITNSKP